MADHDRADAIVLSGVEMPTLPILHRLKQDFGKPVLSATAALGWHVVRLAGYRHAVGGYGRLLELG